MTTLDFNTLLTACSPGGASVLTVVTELAPAAGAHAAIAPARYVRGTQAAYAYEPRFIGGEPQMTVLVDSKGSQLNRVEDALANAILDGEEPLAQTPRMLVRYADGQTLEDYRAPHRAWDGHFRAGSVDGEPATANEVYRAARNVTAANVRALLELSPVSAVLGSWDSTRKSNQVRLRSALTGEIIGVLADQSDTATEPPVRGGARVDPLSPSVRLAGPDMERLLVAQEGELSDKNVTDIRKSITKAKKGTISASPLGLGSIPPSLSSLGLVACRRIIRSHVLSFSALRQLRFGSPGAGDVACRALLASLALAALVRSNEELVLRANCDLVEASAPQVLLDARNGSSTPLDGLGRQAADELLSEAIDLARAAAGIRWEGQVFEVQGNPLVVKGASDAEPED